MRAMNCPPRLALPVRVAMREAAAVARAAALLLLAGSAQAQVYMGQLPGSESVLLTNFASERAPHLLVAAVPADTGPAGTADTAAPGPSRPFALHGQGLDSSKVATREPDRRLALLIAQVAQEHGLPTALLKAVVAAESGFNPAAVSAKGAIGLMQLMPATAQRFGAGDARDHTLNLRAGARYLRWLLDLFQGDVRLALAGYNAGEQAVLRAGRRVPDYPETQGYVPRVLALQARFQGTPSPR
jgi:soluble lytic murein transglycosylase-like protein